MFNSEIPMARHPYYVMTTDMDWFVQIRTDGECLLTGDIDAAFHTYNKDKAFRIFDKCNVNGMNVKVVILRNEITLWNGDVTR